MALQLNPVLQIKNGGIECLLLGGDIPSTRASQGAAIDVTAFSNRVKKNARSLKGWVKQSNVQAYRLYDADLPDFSVAIDIYNADEKHCVVQEYKAPRTVNIAVAADRLAGVMDCLPGLLDIPPQNVHLRLRERQGGTAQYTKSDSTQSVVSTVEEYGARYEVNFTDYLDTGLFPQRSLRCWEALGIVSLLICQKPIVTGLSVILTITTLILNATKWFARMSWGGSIAMPLRVMNHLI